MILILRAGVVQCGQYVGADLTPFAFSLTGVVLAFGVLRFLLFDLAPVAHDLLIEKIDDGVIVLDRDSRVVDMVL